MKTPLNPKHLIAIIVLSAPLVAAPAQAGWEEGVAAFRSRDYTTAAKEFQTVVQDQPEWPGGYFMLGQALQKLKRNEDALRNLRKAYDLNPNDVSYQMALAKSYFDNRRYSDTSSLLGKISVSSLPAGQQTAYHQMVAASYEKSGRSDLALESRATLARTNPNDANAQYAYGLAAFNAGQTSTAVTALGKAVNLDASDVSKREAYVKVLIRRARETRGGEKKAAYDKAADAVQALASTAPTYDNLLTAGEVYLGAKRYDSAVSAFERAASKNSSDWLVKFYQGQALTSLERYDEAAAALQSALGKATGNDKNKVWSQIGFVNEKLRRFDDAKEAYRNANDTASLSRVEENERIALENQQIEADNEAIRAMEAERQKLEDELKALPGSGPPPSF